MITREQVADLQPGDVVALISAAGLPTTVQGVLRSRPERGARVLTLDGGLTVRRADGSPVQLWIDEGWLLTVVSRAPRPLYVNHPRTEPAMGDVVGDVQNGGADWTWHRIGSDWLRSDGADFDTAEMPTRLRLLVDGETGQVVPS